MADTKATLTLPDGKNLDFPVGDDIRTAAAAVDDFTGWGRTPASHGDLIRVRADFVGELVKSIERL